jgi:transposase
MWVRSTPSDEKKIVLFDYDSSRGGDVVKQLLSEYEGFLQVDGYQAYNSFFKENPHAIRLGCGMHSRRKFYDAAQGSNKGQSLAEQGLRYFQALYEIEERAKEKDPSQRFLLRLYEARPIWVTMKAWADKNYRLVPPKSKIGSAFHYLIEEYEYLIGYLQDGRLEMDNGFVERSIKGFAVGRKNWLFSDTVEGAQASSLFYSFVVTAKINGVNPYQALHRIFDDVPTASTPEDYERLADILLGLR